MTIDTKDILKATRAVTKKWTQQRKAEERGRRGSWTRPYVYSDRVKFTDVADDILPDGYAHASGNGKYTVDKRQFYYACREAFRKATGNEITAEYFCQTLIVKYANTHDVDWKITACPRGTLTIPNCVNDRRIPVGTVAIEEHLQDEQKSVDVSAADAVVNVIWPSVAAGQRYQAVLYIEKEGFDPQLREADIANRYSIAIISCKGQSVTAARRYVDQVCYVGGGVPLLVMHDLDKAGFSICDRLTTVSDHARMNDLVKYEFENEIDVTDLGLRLTDVEEYDLPSEKCKRARFVSGDTSATPEEQEFLIGGRRVELNAFTAPQFIEWTERKLQECGIRQGWIPHDDEVLDTAYRRAVIVSKINAEIARIQDDFDPDEIEVPKLKTLRRMMRKHMSGKTLAWDQVLYELAAAGGTV